ncbi:hypothetical protein BC831DRAFT_509784 [Entophlyctis helioformis]|nr:hypothetical protein BC831DRAFT_509784 [Entophlyctis helioformis]
MGEAAAWPSKPHQRDANATAPAGTDEAWLGPPFGQLQMLAACILTFICTAGVLLNTVLLLAMSRSRYSAAPANVPHVHLAMINLAACVGKLAVSIPSLILGHYPFAHLGCQIEGFLVQVLSGLAKLTVLAAAISPYFVVALSRPSMSRSQSVAVLVACWLFMLVTSSFPFMRSHSREDQDQAAGVTVPPYVVQASGVYCHLDFTSNDPLTLTVCVADAIIISIMPFVIGGLYGHISIKLRQLASRMRTKRKKRTAAELESMMARRGLVMSASQIVCWFVSAFRMCSELLNRRRVHPLANVVEYILIALSHVVYVVAMIFDDKRIRSALWSMGEQMVGCLCPADDPAFGMSDETLDREADHDTVARSIIQTQSRPEWAASPTTAAASTPAVPFAF